MLPRQCTRRLPSPLELRPQQSTALHPNQQPNLDNQSAAMPATLVHSSSSRLQRQVTPLLPGRQRLATRLHLLAQPPTLHPSSSSRRRTALTQMLRTLSSSRRLTRLTQLPPHMPSSRRQLVVPTPQADTQATTTASRQQAGPTEDTAHQPSPRRTMAARHLPSPAPCLITRCISQATAALLPPDLAAMVALQAAPVAMDHRVDPSQGVTPGATQEATQEALAVTAPRLTTVAMAWAAPAATLAMAMAAAGTLAMAAAPPHTTSPIMSPAREVITAGGVAPLRAMVVAALTALAVVPCTGSQMCMSSLETGPAPAATSSKRVRCGACGGVCAAPTCTA